MIVAGLPPGDLARRLRGEGLRLRTGPVIAGIRSDVGAVAEGIALHYARHELADARDFVDFEVAVERPRGPRRWLRPQVVFRFDGDAPFAPLPLDQGFPMLEWGLNWCLSSHYHRCLTLHAAVVERAGRALILPAPSGTGKSTLCAGLVFSGWRLLSDELTLLDLDTGRVLPLARPLSLKNASIGVVRDFAPSAVFGRVVRDTSKGCVAHVRAPADSVERAGEPALPGWILLPRHVPGAAATLAPLSKARALMHLVDNAFNYNVHGRAGFELLAELVERCDCHEFAYGRLADAADLLARLAAPQAGAPSASPGRPEARAVLAAGNAHPAGVPG